ncbi:MAG TPA: dihydrofolate reductase family protein [Mycobacteriales bacterium]|nr:dihydrofolate reductase family protein [Mycobacteriales bacterium]
MTDVLVGLSMSVDGFSTGGDPDAEHGLGLGGEPLHVIMGGAEVAREAIAAGLVDEVRLHVAPILLGAGTRLFRGTTPIELRPVSATHTPNATHLVYRIDH